MTPYMNQSIYGIDCGTLIMKNNEDWDGYVVNEELLYGFCNELKYVCLEEALQKTIWSLKKYVQTGGNMTYAIVSKQSKCMENKDAYTRIQNNTFNVNNIDNDYFYDIRNIVWSACKVNGTYTEYFLEDELKQALNNKIKEDIYLFDAADLVYGTNRSSMENRMLNAACRGMHGADTTIKEMLAIPMVTYKQFRCFGETAMSELYSFFGRLSEVLNAKYSAETLEDVSDFTIPGNLQKSAKIAQHKANDAIPQGTYNAAWLHGYATALADVANSIQVPEEIPIFLLQCVHKSGHGADAFVSVHKTYEEALRHAPEVKAFCGYDADSRDERFDFKIERDTINISDFLKTKKGDKVNE